MSYLSGEKTWPTFWIKLNLVFLPIRNEFEKDSVSSPRVPAHGSIHLLQAIQPFQSVQSVQFIQSIQAIQAIQSIIQIYNLCTRAQD